MMNLEKIKSKIIEIENSIPRNRWIEIPIDEKFWKYFDYRGLYAIYSKEKIIYIGISSSIYSRLNSHMFSDNNKFRNKEKISKIKIKIKSDPEDSFLLQYLEKRLIDKLRPKYNKQIVSKYILKYDFEKLGI